MKLSTERVPRDFDAPAFAWSDAEEQAAWDAAIAEILASNAPKPPHARLIAAAPDLLEALKYARRMMKSDSDTLFVEAAIAKAEGHAAPSVRARNKVR